MEFIKNKDKIRLLKLRDIYMVYKGKGNKMNGIYYRSLSITSINAKIINKIILKELNKYWNLIHPKQYGFRKKMETKIAVLSCINQLKKWNEYQEL